MKSDAGIQIATMSPLASIRGKTNVGRAEPGSGIAKEREIFLLAKP
jgi:hypothetical protein